MSEFKSVTDTGVKPESIQPPKGYSDIARYLAERADSQMEEAWELQDKLNAPNGMSLHDMLAAMEDEDVRAHLIELAYPHLLQEEHKTPEEAARILLYSARNLLSSEAVRRAMGRGMLLAKRPESERRFRTESAGACHRKELEQTLRFRLNSVPVRFGIDGLDGLIPGGIKAGEVLHIVGGEGGLKTSLLLHILCDYISRGGRAVFFSLDMTPGMIELRRLMRILNCGRERAAEHVKHDTGEYRRARGILEEEDANLSIMGGPLGLTQMREAILMSGADVAAIDYVTLAEGFRSELEAAREVTRAVRDWRRIWGVTFILLSQMSRESRRDAASGGTGGHGIGGSSLEQLVDYEVELTKDEPLIPGDKPRQIATLRKNRSGKSGVSFEIFPCFPSLTFTKRSCVIEREKKRKPLFSAYIQ
jgi:KaiC/GvpD/RAD55 family RecA-like ATPase